MGFVIWPRALFARYVVEREDVDIGKTHQVHPENLDAMIEMCNARFLACHLYRTTKPSGSLGMWPCTGGSDNVTGGRLRGQRGIRSRPSLDP
jgi:hypothetical protein